MAGTIPQQIREYLKMREQHTAIEKQIEYLTEDLAELESAMGEAKAEMAEANRTLLAIWDGAE